ncbi:MAG: response regulator [Chloroflexota bacterium]|nr:response regulator [Chloroflexota bacterium]
MGGERPALPGRRVLVVEDDRAVLDLLDGALREEGYRVRRAEDGVEALEAIREQTPDLVIADVHLPRLDGGQLVRRLRDENVPVILLSGDPNWARTPGVAFVAKPFDLDHLLLVVARLLSVEGQ